MDTETRAAKSLNKISRSECAIILGTGLGIMEEEITILESIPYSQIPGFPVSSVAGHSGRLLSGLLGTCRVVVMSGRFHLYEGYTPRQVTFPIRVFSLMGVKQILISNAAGGLRPDLTPGRVMMITDHINFTGLNPLTGPNDEAFGPRFPDMTRPYAPGLLDKARQTAAREKIALKEGVYVQVQGPSMETASETRMLRALGADAVGMSTVMEVIQAVHCGMDVLAISAITNTNDPDNYQPAPLKEVIANAEKAGPAIARIFKGILE
ncbi:MAG: purine-nucleoside phosphorylase [Desulfomonilia bacterium]